MFCCVGYSGDEISFGLDNIPMMPPLENQGT